MNRPRVLVTNWESSDNLGDYAILLAQVALLEGSVGATVRLLGNQPGVTFPPELANRRVGDSPWPSPWRHGGLAWGKGLLLAALSLLSPALVGFVSPQHASVVRTMAAADVVMPEGGGYLLADESPRRVLFLARTVYPLLLARRLGVARVLWGHSIGPVSGALSRALLRAALADCTIVARDDTSIEVCAALGLRAERAPDLALLSAAQASPRRRSQSRTSKVHVGVTAKRISADSSVQARYMAAMAAALRLMADCAAREELDVVFDLVPQVVGPTAAEDDRPALAELAKSLPHLTVAQVQRPKTVGDAMELYSGFDLVLATRLHSAILAACAGTPSAIYGYVGGKAQGFVQDVGLPAWVATSRIEEIPNTAVRCYRARVQLRAQLESGLVTARSRLAQLRLPSPGQRAGDCPALEEGAC